MMLSVLIPSVPSRREMAYALFDKISKQAESYDVEVLMLVDNKKRSIGKKREALVQASRGDYVAFVDDDDDVSPDYIQSICSVKTYPRLDVIVFDSNCSLNGGKPAHVVHSIYYPNEPYHEDGFHRSAWHIHAWKGELARSVPFPNSSYGEDWPWCKAMIDSKPLILQEKIEKILYHYQFDAKVTEAA